MAQWESIALAPQGWEGQEPETGEMREIPRMGRCRLGPTSGELGQPLGEDLFFSTATSSSVFCPVSNSVYSTKLPGAHGICVKQEGMDRKQETTAGQQGWGGVTPQIIRTERPWGGDRNKRKVLFLPNFPECSEP